MVPSRYHIRDIVDICQQEKKATIYGASLHNADWQILCVYFYIDLQNGATAVKF